MALSPPTNPAPLSPLIVRWEHKSRRFPVVPIRAVRSSRALSSTTIFSFFSGRQSFPTFAVRYLPDRVRKNITLGRVCVHPPTLPGRRFWVFSNRLHTARIVTVTVFMVVVRNHEFFAITSLPNILLYGTIVGVYTLIYNILLLFVFFFLSASIVLCFFVVVVVNR